MLRSPAWSFSYRRCLILYRYPSSTKSKGTDRKADTQEGRGKIENGLQVQIQVTSVEHDVNLIKEGVDRIELMLRKPEGEIQQMSHEEAEASANAVNQVCHLDRAHVIGFYIHPPHSL